MIFKNPPSDHNKVRHCGKACLRIILSEMKQIEVLRQTGRKNKFFKEICIKNKKPLASDERYTTCSLKN